MTVDSKSLFAGENRSRLKILRFFLNLSVTAIIFYFFWKRIDLTSVITSIAEARPALLISAVCASLVMTTVFAPLQWKYFLKLFSCRIGFLESLFIKLSVAPLKGLLPLKTGELFRCGYLYQQHGFPITMCLKAIVINFTISLFILLVFSSLAGLFYLNQGSLYRVIFLIVILLIMIIIAIIYKYKTNKKKEGQNILGRISSAMAFLRLSDKKDIRRIISLSLAVEFSELFAFFLICRSMEINVSLGLVLFLLPIVIIIANLPITIFGLGAREAAILFLFSNSALPTKLLGCSLIYSFICYILPAIVGLTCTGPFLNMLLAKLKGKILREQA